MSSKTAITASISTERQPRPPTRCGRTTFFVNIVTALTTGTMQTTSEFIDNRQLTSAIRACRTVRTADNAPTLPLNSGDVYQNALGMKLIVNQPVYATVPATPRTSRSISVRTVPPRCCIRMSSAVIRPVVRRDLVTVTVPPGFYCQFTTSGATLANAVIYADELADDLDPVVFYARGGVEDASSTATPLTLVILMPQLMPLLHMQQR